MRAWLKARETVLMDAAKIAEARAKVEEAVARLQDSLALLDAVLEEESRREGPDG